MRILCAICWVSMSVGAQIGKPPEFQNDGKFQTSTSAGMVDGTSHVSANREQINEELVSQLRRLPGSADGVRLIGNRMLPLAEESFRKSGLEIGVVVTKFLSGKEEASAALLCALAKSAKKQSKRLELLPFLGETVGSVPSYSGLMLTIVSEIAAAHAGHSEAQFYWALALLKQTPAKVTEALPHLKLSSELDQKSTKALLELGRQYTILERRTEAIDVLEEALRRDGTLAAAEFRLAQLYRLAGNTGKSSEHLSRFQKLQQPGR